MRGIGRLPLSVVVVGLVGLMLSAATAAAETGKTVEDGKYFTADEEPTYNVKEDGTVDWYTYSGFRRYHSECHVCHGPDGLGSTYAPALSDSMSTMSYEEFLEVVINGRERVTESGAISKMPSLGDNVNVTCYIDDLYVYLKARADQAIPRSRPRKREPKPQAAKDDENACRGT